MAKKKKRKYSRKKELKHSRKVVRALRSQGIYGVLKRPRRSKVEVITAGKFFTSIPSPDKVLITAQDDTHDERMDLTLEDMKIYVPKCTDTINIASEPSCNTRRLMEDVMRRQSYPTFKLGEPNGT